MDAFHKLRRYYARYLLSLILFISGCSGGGSGEIASGRAADSECGQISTIHHVRTRDLNSARQIEVKLLDADRDSLPMSLTDCLTVTDENQHSLDFTASGATSSSGATLIVAQSSAQTGAASRRFIEELIRNRPADEEIAVWLWAGSIKQVIAPTKDRNHINQRLNDVWNGSEEIPLAAEQVFNEAASKWSQIAGNNLSGIRSLVFFAPELTAHHVPKNSYSRILDYWYTGGSSVQNNRIWNSSQEATKVAKQISSRLDQVSSAPAININICDDGKEKEISILSDGASSLLSLDDLPKEKRGKECLQPPVETEPREIPLSINIEFSSEQRLQYDQRITNLDKSNFDGSITLNDNPEKIKMHAKLHGSSSLFCERKSYSINLAGNQRRDLIKDFSGDEFYLISMCLDDFYINQINGSKLMEEIFAWKLPTELVELKIDNTSQGAYWFIEKPEEYFKRSLTNLDAVIRRKTDSIGDQPEIEWADNEKNVAAEQYQSFLQNILSYQGNDLVSELRKTLDLDQYLRWIALNTLLENGDYIDEVYFVATESINNNQNHSKVYQIQGWDADDLFSPCHYQGQYAYVDNNELLYCTESLLDHKIFSVPSVYALYVETLEQVIQEITVPAFNKITLATLNNLVQVLEHNDAYKSMSEMQNKNPAAIDFEVMKNELTAATQALHSKFNNRRQLLNDRIASWKRKQSNIRLQLYHPAQVPADSEIPIVVKAIDENGNLDQNSSGWITLEIETNGAIEQQSVLMRKGIGSVTQAFTGDHATLNVLNENTGASEVSLANAPPVQLSGELSDAQLNWNNSNYIYIVDDILIPADKTLSIGAGTVVLINPEKNIIVNGSISVLGSNKAPVLFSAADASLPWGGIVVESGTGEFNHSFFLNGGNDSSRQFGHSSSQSMLFSDNGEITVKNSIFQDAPGKGIGGRNSRFNITDTLVTRTDMGAELINSSANISNSQFFDFPELNPSPRDDDNDAIYLYADPDFKNQMYTLDTVTVISGADDGIDHNGSNVEVKNSWIEGFHHECIAASGDGKINISNTALFSCEQGLEAGWGTPIVTGNNLLISQCDTGLRFGDEYSLSYEGSMTILDSIIYSNQQAVLNEINTTSASKPGAIKIQHSILDSRNVEMDTSNLIAKPILDRSWLLKNYSPGWKIGSNNSNPGLLN